MDTGSASPEGPKLDADGHLADPGDWTPAWAESAAAADGIRLEVAHWWLIEFVRDYHEAYGNPPLMRVAVAALRKREPGAGSRDLYRLFADHPIRQACRYGGLPRPDWCI